MHLRQGNEEEAKFLFSEHLKEGREQSRPSYPLPELP